MAHDQTPPRLKLILQVAIAAPIILIGLKFVFDSYFIYMSEEAHYDKMAPTTDLDALHQAEQKNLTTGPVPITAAMLEISKGRAEQGGPDLIAPKPSDDTASLVGWSKTPRTFEVPQPAGADAGLSSDAGPSANLPADAGAPTDGGARDGGRSGGADAGRPH